MVRQLQRVYIPHARNSVTYHCHSLMSVSALVTYPPPTLLTLSYPFFFIIFTFPLHLSLFFDSSRIILQHLFIRISTHSPLLTHLQKDHSIHPGILFLDPPICNCPETLAQHRIPAIPSPLVTTTKLTSYSYLPASSTQPSPWYVEQSLIFQNASSREILPAIIGRARADSVSYRRD